MNDLEKLLKGQPTWAAAYPLLMLPILAQRSGGGAAVARKFMAVAPQRCSGSRPLLGLSLAAQGKRPEAKQQFRRMRCR